MKKFLILSVVALAAVSVAVTAAFAKPAKRTATADVCVLLPDTKTSVRWEQFDRPFMEKTLTAAKVSHTIVNALGDPQKQTAQAEQCLANGAKVIIIAPIDSVFGGRDREEGRGAGAKSIDYDRQVEGGNAVAYLSFDGKTVGKLQAQAVINGLKAKGMYSKKPVVAALWGGQVDANAYLFKSGNDVVLNPLYQEQDADQGPAAVRQGLGRPDGADGLRADARQDEQQDRRRHGGERQPRQLGRGLAEGAQAQADPAERPGRDPAGRAEHHLRLADGDGVQGRPQAGGRRGEHGCCSRQGQAGQVHGVVKTKGRGPEKAILIAPENITRRTSGSSSRADS